MPVPEFELISQYFRQQQVQRADVLLGIGDDAAIIRPAEDMEQVVAVDTLVAGVHFPHDTRAQDIGWKALAVNLSDLAAMGAEPAWFTLALTLPESSSDWLAAFSQGMFELSRKYNLQLVGGDTTRGPLSVTVQIAGYAPHGASLTRSTAMPGDQVYVSGSLGDAALALALLQGGIQTQTGSVEEFIPYIYTRLNRPTPRIELGMKLRGIASSCIDISDGLLADLGHILEASEKNQCGARIYLDKLPLSEAAQAIAPNKAGLQALALTGGDDYELCFTVASQNLQQLGKVLAQTSLACTAIGEITAEAGRLECLDAQGKPVTLSKQGYQHFGTDTV